MKILFFAGDAYGGWGGIAQFNRDVIDAMCGDPKVRGVVALVRSLQRETGTLPEKLEYRTDGVAGRSRFTLDAVKTAMVTRDAAFLFCAHINLAPVVWLASRITRKPWVLAIHGVEAWKEQSSKNLRFFASRADKVIAVSGVTMQRFQSWCPVPDARTAVLPNALRNNRFGVMPKNEALVRRYGLAGRKVILTLGRLDSFERYKGFDAVLDVLPDIVRTDPEICYLIAGDGRDRQRLEDRVVAAGLGGHVVFTGIISEAEKADHYRLADAFVMASKGEGFGIVLLEAMACGVPVIASSADGSQEAVRNGMLGQVVDPDDGPALVAAIKRTIFAPKRVPEGLDYFDYPNFADRVRAALADVAPRW